MAAPNRKLVINRKVSEILTKIGVSTLPVKVDDIAKSLGVDVVPYPFDDDISGTLIIDGDIGTIGYNQYESRVRRRFTIAHELGHFELHRDRSTMFLDKQFKVHFRSNASKHSEEIQEMEQEANAFAAALLMPEDLIRNQVKDVDIDLGSEEGIRHLARVFDVSTQAMSFRLANLGLFEI